MGWTEPASVRPGWTGAVLIRRLGPESRSYRLVWVASGGALAGGGPPFRQGGAPPPPPPPPPRRPPPPQPPHAWHDHPAGWQRRVRGPRRARFAARADAT